MNLREEVAKRELPQVRPLLGQSETPNLPENSVDMAFMHYVLFHGDVLLPALRERLVDGGRVFILARKSDQTLSHREASHRRMIAPQSVEEEMSQYGFELNSSFASSSPRFLQVYVATDGQNAYHANNKWLKT